MDRPTLITGGTGFVGSAIAQHSSSGATVRIARRRREDNEHLVHAVDVTDRSALRQIAHGVGSIIHCASYVGHDPDQAWHVNDEGTRVLLEVAAEFGIRNITYISTAGVYGAGAQDGTNESATPAPASEASRSRLAAERRVLEVGGSVIRPHLTYGIGDRWFIPRLIDAATLLGGIPRGVKVSTISVDALAQQVWALHHHAERHGGGTTRNARHDLPTTLDSIVRMCQRSLAPKMPVAVVDAEAARLVLLEAGFTPHQADMLTQPNWFTSNHSPHRIELSAPQQFQLSPPAIAWYRGI